MHNFGVTPPHGSDYGGELSLGPELDSEQGVEPHSQRPQSYSTGPLGDFCGGSAPRNPAQANIVPSMRLMPRGPGDDARQQPRHDEDHLRRAFEAIRERMHTRANDKGIEPPSIEDGAAFIAALAGPHSRPAARRIADDFADPIAEVLLLLQAHGVLPTTFAHMYFRAFTGKKLAELPVDYDLRALVDAFLTQCSTETGFSVELVKAFATLQHGRGVPTAPELATLLRYCSNALGSWDIERVRAIASMVSGHGVPSDEELARLERYFSDGRGHWDNAALTSISNLFRHLGLPGEDDLATLKLSFGDANGEWDHDRLIAIARKFSRRGMEYARDPSALQAAFEAAESPRSVRIKAFEAIRAKLEARARSERGEPPSLGDGDRFIRVLTGNSRAAAKRIADDLADPIAATLLLLQRYGVAPTSFTTMYLHAFTGSNLATVPRNFDLAAAMKQFLEQCVTATGFSVELFQSFAALHVQPGRSAAADLERLRPYCHNEAGYWELGPIRAIAAMSNARGVPSTDALDRLARHFSDGHGHWDGEAIRLVSILFRQLGIPSEAEIVALEQSFTDGNGAWIHDRLAETSQTFAGRGTLYREGIESIDAELRGKEYVAALQLMRNKLREAADMQGVDPPPEIGENFIAMLLDFHGSLLHVDVPKGVSRLETWMSTIASTVVLFRKRGIPPEAFARLYAGAFSNRKMIGLSPDLDLYSPMEDVLTRCTINGAVSREMFASFSDFMGRGHGPMSAADVDQRWQWFTDGRDVSVQDAKIIDAYLSASLASRTSFKTTRANVDALKNLAVALRSETRAFRELGDLLVLHPVVANVIVSRIVTVLPSTLFGKSKIPDAFGALSNYKDNRLLPVELMGVADVPRDAQRVIEAFGRAALEKGEDAGIVSVHVEALSVLAKALQATAYGGLIDLLKTSEPEMGEDALDFLFSEEHEIVRDLFDVAYVKLFDFYDSES